MGDGKYFAIPKPRELAVLTSFFETCMEYGVGENDRAFNEFYDYAVDNFLPSVASDLAKGDWQGAIGSLGIIGVGSYMMANRDFLGKPIVSAGMQYYESKDQYNDRTSKLAYYIGQAFNQSPQMIDYFFQQTLGGLWKYQKALWPVGGENRDITLGVQNSYIKDNQYSTDLVNWMYDQAEASGKSAKSNPGDMDKAITAKMDAKMTEFYSNYNRLSKDEPETTRTRAVRQTVLTMILEYQKASDSNETTRAQDSVYSVVRSVGDTSYLPSVMNPYVTDGEEMKHNLSAVQYVEYQTDYNRLYWEYAEEHITVGMGTKEKAAILKAAKNAAKEEATNRVLARIGEPQTRYAQKYSGISSGDVIEYKAQIETETDGSPKQDEVISIIESMLNNGLSYEDAYLLFRTEYNSDKNNPWKKYAPKK